MKFLTGYVVTEFCYTVNDTEPLAMFETLEDAEIYAKNMACMSGPNFDYQVWEAHPAGYMVQIENYNGRWNDD